MPRTSVRSATALRPSSLAVMSFSVAAAAYIEQAARNLELVRRRGGVAGALQHPRHHLRQLVQRPHAVLEDRPGGQGVVEKGDGASVDVEHLAVDVPGVVAGQVADHGADALRSELLELRGAGGAGARPLLGDRGGEAGPGAGG